MYIYTHINIYTYIILDVWFPWNIGDVPLELALMFLHVLGVFFCQLVACQWVMNFKQRDIGWDQNRGPCLPMGLPLASLQATAHP